jgi:hypothetical protein
MNAQCPRSHYLCLLLCISLICLFLSCSQASTARETFKKTISFSAGGYLQLTNTNGNVDVTAWDRQEVEIIAYKEVKASDKETAENLLKKLVIDVRERNGEIIIDTDYPQRSGSGSVFSWLFGGNGKSFSVQYELKVPRQIDLNLETTNGDIDVAAIAGRIRLESTNGQIDGSDIQGVARCRTTNGSIKMEFSEISGEDKMSFKSTNGSIKLYLPDDFAADVELKTTNGHIDSDFTMNGGGRRSRTRLKGKINTGGRELSCTTTNGNIILNRK